MTALADLAVKAAFAHCIASLLMIVVKSRVYVWPAWLLTLATWVGLLAMLMVEDFCAWLFGGFA